MAGVSRLCALCVAMQALQLAKGGIDALPERPVNPIVSRDSPSVPGPDVLWRNIQNLDAEIQEWKRRGLPEKIPFFRSRNEIVEANLLDLPPTYPKSDDDWIIRENVFYFMFNRNISKSGVKFTRNAESIKATGFDPRKPTKIIIHGFSNNITSEIFSIIVPNLLLVGDFNVIGVDWGPLATDPFYITARSYVKPVGEDVAKTVDFLAESLGLDTRDVHIMGHSLGAHISGTCGKSVRAGRIERITAMDPALPLFTSPSADKLANTDASVVDVIHTTAGLIGQTDALGTVDFYPNGGSNPQPGCGFDKLGACSHSRAFQYMAESILLEGAYLSTLCSSTSNARRGLCRSNVTANMGYHLKFSYTSTLRAMVPAQRAMFIKSMSFVNRKAGPYYLKTGPNPPYDLTTAA